MVEYFQPANINPFGKPSALDSLNAEIRKLETLDYQTKSLRSQFGQLSQSYANVRMQCDRISTEVTRLRRFIDGEPEA